MENVIDPDASKEVAMTSLDWCTRSRQLTLLNAVLAAHFSTCAISDLERECSLVLRNAVTSGCKDALVSLLRHVDDAFLQQHQNAENKDDIKGSRTRLDKLLGLSVELGHRNVAEVLLWKGANPNSWYRNKPLLHLSLTLGHHPVALLLMQHGADVSTIDSKGETPIFAALSSSHLDQIDTVVDEIIGQGEDVNHRSFTGRQPIHCAALLPNCSTLVRLAENGCDVNTKDGVMGDTPLHLACSRCCQEAVVTLIRHGADLNAVNNHGDTPLRKLLQHATRVSKDFHHNTRLKLARVLVCLGFRLSPPDHSQLLTHELDKKICIPPSQRTPKTQTILSERRVLNPRNPAHTTGEGKQTVSRPTLAVKPSFCSLGSRPVGRDKVAEMFQSLLNERKGVPSLQHLCRLVVRHHLPGVRFQTSVKQLDLSPQMQQYLMFWPRLIDDTV